MASLHEAYSCYSDIFDKPNNCLADLDVEGLDFGTNRHTNNQIGGSSRERQVKNNFNQPPVLPNDYIEQIELPEHKNILNIDDDSPEQAQNFYVSPIQTNVIEDIDAMDDFDPVYAFQQRSKDIAFQIPYNSHVSQSPDDGRLSLTLSRSGERKIETIKELGQDPDIKFARKNIPDATQPTSIEKSNIAQQKRENAAIENQNNAEQKITNLRAAAGLATPPQNRTLDQDLPNTLIERRAAARLRSNARTTNMESADETIAPREVTRLRPIPIEEAENSRPSSRRIGVPNRRIARQSYTGISTDLSNKAPDTLSQGRSDLRTVGNRRPASDRLRIRQTGRGLQFGGGSDNVEHNSNPAPDCSDTHCMSMIDHIIACPGCLEKMKKLVNLGHNDLNFLGIDIQNIDMSKMMFYIIVIILIIAIFEFLNSLFSKLKG